MNCCSNENIQSGTSKAEKDLARVCPSKLSKRELEEHYYSLLHNNMELKKTVNKQNEKIKVLSTRLQRAAMVKADRGRDNTCCAEVKATVKDQKESISELRRANERLTERIKQLNMKLCSAKQFLRGPSSFTPRLSKSARPDAASAKNMSTSALNPKRAEVDIGNSASCQSLNKNTKISKSTGMNDQEKEAPSISAITKPTEPVKRPVALDLKPTDTDNRRSFALDRPAGADKISKSSNQSNEVGSLQRSLAFDLTLEAQGTDDKSSGKRESNLAEMHCDENKCRTFMDELKQKVADLQEELTKAHTEYATRISRLEKEVVDLHGENLRVVSASAARAHELERRGREAGEVVARLRETEEQCGNLTTQLAVERGKVAELETQVKAAILSNQVARTIEGHLAKKEEKSKYKCECDKEKHSDVDCECDKDSSGNRHLSVECECYEIHEQLMKPNHHNRPSVSRKHKCECKKDAKRDSVQCECDRDSSNKRRKSVQCECNIDSDVLLPEEIYDKDPFSEKCECGNEEKCVSEAQRCTVQCECNFELSEESFLCEYHVSDNEPDRNSAKLSLKSTQDTPETSRAAKAFKPDQTDAVRQYTLKFKESGAMAEPGYKKHDATLGPDSGRRPPMQRESVNPDYLSHTSRISMPMADPVSAVQTSSTRRESIAVPHSPQPYNPQECPICKPVSPRERSVSISPPPDTHKVLVQEPVIHKERKSVIPASIPLNDRISIDQECPICVSTSSPSKRVESSPPDTQRPRLSIAKTELKPDIDRMAADVASVSHRLATHEEYPKGALSSETPPRQLESIAPTSIGTHKHRASVTAERTPYTDQTNADASMPCSHQLSMQHQPKRISTASQSSPKHLESNTSAVQMTNNQDMSSADPINKLRVVSTADDATREPANSKEGSASPKHVDALAPYKDRNLSISTTAPFVASNTRRVSTIPEASTREPALYMNQEYSAASELVDESLSPSNRRSISAPLKSSRRTSAITALPNGNRSSVVSDMPTSLRSPTISTSPNPARHRESIISATRAPTLCDKHLELYLEDAEPMSLTRKNEELLAKIALLEEQLTYLKACAAEESHVDPILPLSNTDPYQAQIDNDGQETNEPNTFTPQPITRKLNRDVTDAELTSANASIESPTRDKDLEKLKEKTKTSDEQNKYQIPGPLPVSSHRDSITSAPKRRISDDSKTKKKTTPRSQRRMSGESVKSNKSVKISNENDDYDRKDTDTYKQQNETVKEIRPSIDSSKVDKINADALRTGKRSTFIDDNNLQLDRITSDTKVEDLNDYKKMIKETVDEYRRSLADISKTDNWEEYKDRDIQTDSPEVSTTKENNRNSPNASAYFPSPLHMTSSPLYEGNNQGPVSALKREDTIVISSNEPDLHNKDDPAEDNQLDICEQYAQICKCPHAQRRDVAVFRSCSGTLRFKTTSVGASKFRRCKCYNTDDTQKQDCGQRQPSHEEQSGNKNDPIQINTRNQNIPTTHLYQSPTASQPRTYVLQGAEEVMSKGTMSENTDHEISSITDLPSEREPYVQRPPTPLSPGEQMATTTYTDSSTMPIDYGSLSEGELPMERRARKSSATEKHTKDAGLEAKPISIERRSSLKMEETLLAIGEELTRCRQLLMATQRSQEVT